MFYINIFMLIRIETEWEIRVRTKTLAAVFKYMYWTSEETFYHSISCVTPPPTILVLTSEITEIKKNKKIMFNIGEILSWAKIIPLY